MRVFKSRDQVWRAEQHADGWRLMMYGGTVLLRASLDQIVRHLIDAGVNPERDLVED